MNRRWKAVTLFAVFIFCFIGVIAVDGMHHSVVSTPLPQGGSPPVLPMRIYGKIQLDRVIVEVNGQPVELYNVNVPTDTMVSAWINNRVYATTVITFRNGISHYLIDIPGDFPTNDNRPGGNEGDTIRFKIPGYTAIQTIKWEFGGLLELNLLMVRDSVPIPEPLTSVLTTTGLLALAAFRRWWKQSGQQ